MASKADIPSPHAVFLLADGIGFENSIRLEIPSGIDPNLINVVMWQELENVAETRAFDADVLAKSRKRGVTFAVYTVLTDLRQFQKISDVQFTVNRQCAAIHGRRRAAKTELVDTTEIAWAKGSEENRTCSATPKATEEPSPATSRQITAAVAPLRAQIGQRN